MEGIIFKLGLFYNKFIHCQNKESIKLLYIYM